MPVAVQRAAEAYLVANGLDWLDLVPVDLSVDRLVELLWGLDPASFRTDRVAPGRTAGAAMLMRRALADRLDLDSLAPVRRHRPVQLARVAATAKRYHRCAATSSSLRLRGW